MLTVVAFKANQQKKKDIYQMVINYMLMKIEIIVVNENQQN